MSDLKRNIVAGKVLAVTTDLSTTAAMDATGFSAMMVKASETVTLTVYANDSLAGTYLPLKDSKGAAVTIAATATDWIVAEPEIFAASFIKFVGSGAATVTVSGKS